MQAKVCQLYCTSFCCLPKLISFKNSWSCNSSALASEILCIFHAALLWRQSRWAASVLLGAGWIYPDGFPWGTGAGRSTPPPVSLRSAVLSEGSIPCSPPWRHECSIGLDDQRRLFADTNTFLDAFQKFFQKFTSFLFQLCDWYWI